MHHSNGKVAQDTADISRDVLDAGATVTSIGSRLNEELTHDGATHVSVSDELAEHERPLVHAVRSQQIALGLARWRGVDADRPAGLNKEAAMT